MRGGRGWRGRERGEGGEREGSADCALVHHTAHLEAAGLSGRRGHKKG